MKKKIKMASVFKTISCIMLLIFIVGIFVPPFFPQFSFPSDQQRRYILYPENAILISARRKSGIPLFGRNHIHATIIFPPDTNIKEWYRNELASFSPDELKSEDGFLKAIIPLQNTGSVEILVSIHKQTVSYSALFAYW